jgi:uncharacterized protein (TIGR04255 family)
MSEPEFKLANAPIVEAVLDIDCDMPPGQQITSLEDPGRKSFCDCYPRMEKQYYAEHKIERKPDAPPSVSAIDRGIQALRFFQEDRKQLIQVRVQGYSFNRLAPYTSLDDYLPEIERTWKLFLQLTSPVQVRFVRLRYVNRIVLPMSEGKVPLKDYLNIGPYLPDGLNLSLTGFLNQRSAMEAETGHQVNVVLTSQPLENDKLPVIFDNCVTANGPSEPDNWPWIQEKIKLLRTLKNRIFKNTLTESCLNLYR